jgi:hypothetical protein
MDKKEANLVPLVCRNEESSGSESSDESTDNEEPTSINTDDNHLDACEFKNINRTKVSKQFKKKQTKWSTYWSRYKRFVDSPRVHFTYDAIFYIIFLTLFSYMILCEFEYFISENQSLNDLVEKSNVVNVSIYNESNSLPNFSNKNVKMPSSIEYLLIFWVLAFIIEEIRQVIFRFLILLNIQILNLIIYYSIL